MKILKLQIDYNGYYGGNNNEYLILPLQVNGVLFEKLNEGYYENEIYLGEIEGKHSEVYGNLDIKIINLNDLNILELTNLINNSSHNEFEYYFENKEDQFVEELLYEEINYFDNCKNLIDKYELKVSEYSIVTIELYKKFIENLKKEKIQKFKNITVLEKDYEEAISILHNSNLETY